MLQDIKRGAPTEIEAINGAIIREGSKFNIRTPVNNSLYHLIRARVELIGRKDDDQR
jgi:2-dehydropantoate 2-reductase